MGRNKRYLVTPLTFYDYAYLMISFVRWPGRWPGRTRWAGEAQEVMWQENGKEFVGDEEAHERGNRKELENRKDKNKFCLKNSVIETNSLYANKNLNLLKMLYFICGDTVSILKKLWNMMIGHSLAMASLSTKQNFKETSPVSGSSWQSLATS